MRLFLCCHKIYANTGYTLTISAAGSTTGATVALDAAATEVDLRIDGLLADQASALRKQILSRTGGEDLEEPELPPPPDVD